MEQLLINAIELIIENDNASTSLLQRKLILGYNKAEILMFEMEKLGVVGKFNGTKPRTILIKSINEII